MIIPVKVVYDVLRVSDEFKAIPMYLNAVDESTISKKVKPLIRITELPTTYNDSYASNLPTSIVSTVQVDCWCKDMAQANKLYYELDKVLAYSGIMLNSGGLDNDPDYDNTTRIYKRYTVTQHINFE